MTDRRYTIAEIDQMRADLQMAARYRRGPLEAGVLEVWLRTALIAGVDPADVKADVANAHQEAADRYTKAVERIGKEAALDRVVASAPQIEMPDNAHDDYMASPKHKFVSRVTCNT